MKWIKADETKSKTEQAIMDFFVKNPKPTDTQIHSLAESLKMEAHELEQRIYSLLGDFLGHGMFNKSPDTQIDPNELKMGIKVESEHTINDSIAERISKDHLVEIPDYYTRLKKMEEEAKGK